jgi:hypothetical protein
VLSRCNAYKGLFSCGGLWFLQRVLSRSLEVRDEALAEKEKDIAALRTECHTLDNYKYVLDHRVDSMSSERGPVIKHVASLEAHIDDMYAEMVSEFEEKKVSAPRKFPNLDQFPTAVSMLFARVWGPPQHSCRGFQPSHGRARFVLVGWSRTDNSPSVVWERCQD